MIYLIGEVNENMVLRVLTCLDKNPKRANFMLNSIGGSLSDGLAIYDRISVLPESTVTATGVCASAATVILQAARKRRATPNAQFQVHLVDFGDLQDNKDFKIHYDNVVFKIFKKKVTWNNYQRAMDLKVFDAVTARNLNFIDEIWDGKSAKPGLS